MNETPHSNQVAQASNLPHLFTTCTNGAEASEQLPAPANDGTHLCASHREDIEFTSITLSGSHEQVEFVAKVPNFPRFAASADGRVFRLSKGSRPTWHEVKSFMLKNGYLQVSLHNESGKCVQYVHKVVAATFLKPPPGPEYQIDHLWGDKTDNHVANLRWVTAAENIAARSWQKQARAEREEYSATFMNSPATHH